MTGVGRNKGKDVVARPEIILQMRTSNGKWEDVEFFYKPGSEGQRPPFIVPHQPRLDWYGSFSLPKALKMCSLVITCIPAALSFAKLCRQMWFAALHPRPLQSDHWVPCLIARLMEGSQQVVSLLKSVPNNSTAARGQLYLYVNHSKERLLGLRRL